MGIKIFIDPGHGGAEPGAAANGFVEKDLNLQVALKLSELLKQQGIEVKMSRETDIYVDLSERCRMANAWGANYFISIHHNAGGGDGYEVIHSICAGEGKALAEAIGGEFSKTGQNCRRIFSRQGANGDYYCVIRETVMPAVITEYAFLDTSDVQAVDTPEKLEREAEAVSSAVVAYLGLEAPKTTPRHWAQQDHDELRAAGILLSDHTALLDQPATEGMVIALVNHLRKEMSKK